MTPLAQLLADRAREAPQAIVLESARDERCVRRADLAAATEAWAARLDGAGVPPGGRVGLRGRDPLHLAVAWLGVVAAGRSAAPIGPDAEPDVVARWCADIRPWALVEVDEHGLDGSGPAFAVTTGAVATGRSGGVLLTSSGTTGPAKLVELRTDQLLATAGNVVEAHALTGSDRCLNPLPLWHINAEVVGLLATLVAGSTLVLDDRFHRTGFWKTVADREITWVNAVPAVLAILGRETEAPEPPPGPALRFARSASAPLAPSVRAAFEARTGVPVVQTYGMTEAASQITAEPLPGDRSSGRSGGRDPRSVGRPVGIELRVLGEDGAPVPAGGSGRVEVRGPGVVTAYASAAGADRITADGWLSTGDLGWLDAGGELILEGRVDDVINRGGEKFSPQHLEDSLLDVPGVAQLSVVGAPDDVLGQIPVAAVVPVEGADGAEVAAAVVAAAGTRLDRTRRPVRVHVLPDLRSGVNGKVSRRRVLALLAELGLERAS